MKEKYVLVIDKKSVCGLNLMGKGERDEWLKTRNS